jgi:hypothetical protein
LAGRAGWWSEPKSSNEQIVIPMPASDHVVVWVGVNQHGRVVAVNAARILTPYRRREWPYFQSALTGPADAGLMGMYTVTRAE